MTFRAKFNYPVGPDGQPRPYLSLLLGKELPLERPVLGLIDSGSDLSSLPVEFVAVLGLTDADLEQRSIETAAGTHKISQAIRPVLAQLPGAPEKTFELRPLFIPQARHVLWGRDLLSYFALSIAESEQQFTLFAP